MRWSRSARRNTPDPLEIARIVQANVRLSHDLDEDRCATLLELTSELVASKRWEAVQGFALNDEIRATIAANAAIPVLALGVESYRHVHAIVVRPTAASSSGLRAGRAGGTVSDHTMSVIGEAFPNHGPVAISWDSARYESRHPAGGRNVVIHEFAHKIDMTDGYTDGIPPLRGEQLDRWVTVLGDEFEHVEDRPDDEVLDPYAWTNPAEFFAVATETFFCRPTRLAEAKPRLYRALADFYRQDPVTTRPPEL